MLGQDYVEEFRGAGHAAGLDRIGVTSADAFDDARAAIEARKAAGHDGGMQFTFRNPARSTDPHRILAGARSLIVAARAYSSVVAGRPDGPQGRVARYAVEDEYRELRVGLAAIADRLVTDGWQTRVLADDNALVDRAAAHRAALGWYGKNANILLPGTGSWFVLGSVVTDAPLPPAEALVEDGCGACNRCVDGCPTQAIVAPGVVDARRCLAWLVQAEGDFPQEFRTALGDRIYGCDDCQEVCPPNRKVARNPSARSTTGDGAWVHLVALLRQTDQQLLADHGRWYIPRRDPRYVRRNALVALGNVGERSDDVVAIVEHYARGDDAMLQEHARWAATQLGLDVVLAP